MSNLPEGWSSYRFKCEKCGGSYHASGSEECYCREAEEKAAEEIDECEKRAAKFISAGDWKRAREEYEAAACICEEME